jgi:hypothetical protein
VLTGSKADIAAFLKQAEGVVAAVTAKKKKALADLVKGRALAEEKGESRAALRKLDAEIEASRDTRLLVKVFMKLHESEVASEKTISRLKKNLKLEMPANFRRDEEYEISPKVADNLTESTFGDLAGDFAMEQAQMHALKLAANAGEMDKDEARVLREAIIRTSAETLMGRGAGRHQISRVPYLIEGYDTDGAVQLYDDYMTSTAGMLSKAQYAREQFENYRYAPAEVKVWAEKYIKDSLRNMGYADQISGNARMIASFWFLGFKVSSILVNGTQVWTLGVAELGRRTKQNSMKAIFKAQKDIFGGKLSADEKELFNSKIWKLQEMQTTVHETTGAGEGATGKISEFMHTFTNKAMMPFQEMEMLNRQTMILAAYRSGLADGMSKQDAIEFGLDVNRKTNFEMSRANLPGWARKPLGRTAYALQSFVWNNWNWIYNRATSGEKADMLALLKYGAMISVFGGAAALAGGDEADKLYRRIFGRSVKMDLQQWTRANLKNYGTPGELLNDFIWHGGMGMVGINISNAMRLNVPLSGWVTGDSTASEAAMGVFAGLAKKGGQAASFASQGRWGRAIEAAAPAALEAPMRAVRMATEGATTSHGKPVYDEHGKPLKYSAGEAVVRSFGFQPLGQSQRSEVTQHQTKIQQLWSAKRQDALDRFRMERKLKYIAEFNKELRGSQAFGIVNLITPESIQRAVKESVNKKKAAYLRANAID